MQIETVSTVLDCLIAIAFFVVGYLSGSAN